MDFIVIIILILFSSWIFFPLSQIVCVCLNLVFAQMHICFSNMIPLWRDIRYIIAYTLPISIMKYIFLHKTFVYFVLAEISACKAFLFINVLIIILSSRLLLKHQKNVLWVNRAWDLKVFLVFFQFCCICTGVWFLLNAVAGVPWVIAIACRKIMKLHLRIFSELFN